MELYATDCDDDTIHHAYVIHCFEYIQVKINLSVCVCVCVCVCACVRACVRACVWVSEREWESGGVTFQTTEHIRRHTNTYFKNFKNAP